MGLARTLRRGATWLSLGAAAGAVVVTVRHVLDTPQPLESALDGEGRIDRKHGGDIYYNLSGPEDAQPLVLLHDFYPGASNFEFRAIFPPLARRYRVYAPDWLGFGMSEHPAVAYTGEFYASMLGGFLREVVGRPAVVLAHGHAANIAVRSASDAPELFERVILVAPDVFAGVLDEPTLGQTLLRASRRISLGIVPYALLSTRLALRWLSVSRSQRAADGVPDDETIERLYASAHQFGGQYALLAALTGDLDLAMPNAFALLEPPVLIVSGARDQRHPRVDMEDIAVLNPHADLDVIPDAGDSVFLDQPDAFVDAVTSWLDTPASRHTIDEGALLHPSGGADSEPALMAEVRGGLMTEDEEEDEPAVEMPTDGETAPEDLATAGEREMTGAPGSVVPGVSDAGQEGPATVDTAGVATLEEPTVTLGPDTARSMDEAEDASPDELLPEAGEAEPASAAEREARAGVEPPRMPEEPNIADTASPAGDVSAGRGPVAGLAQTVQTPDSVVATPEDVEDATTVATPDEVATPGDVMAAETGAASAPSGEDKPVVPASEEPPPAPSRSSATTRGAGGGARQSLSRAPSEPSPRSQPRTSGKASSASGSTKSSRSGTGRGASSGHGGSGGGRKHSTRKNAK